MSAEDGKSLGTRGLVGQENEEDRVTVRLQRELKRKKDTHRKMEKKLKTLGSDAEKADLSEEMAKIAAEIAALEKTLGDDTTTKSPSAPLGDSAETAAAESLEKKTDSAKPKVPVKKTHLSAAATAAVTTAPNEAAKGQENTLTDEEARSALAEMVRKKIEQSTAAKLSPTPVRNSGIGLVHYQVAELAHMMESMMIVGGNARTFAMIKAFRALLQTTPLLSENSLSLINSKDFERLINANFEFLRRCRVPSAGMTYVKEFFVRRVVAMLSCGEKTFFSSDTLLSVPSFPTLPDTSQTGSVDSPHMRRESSLFENDPRDTVLNILGDIEKEMQLSIKSVVEDRSVPYVSSNDTILVFGRSSTVEEILLNVANNPRLAVKPKVIVVDAAPLYEGRALSKRLTANGLCVTYGLITACCTLLPRCTRVFIGASAVLQNGDVFGRCGTALVVASAKRYRKPVLCFSESFKFLPEVWLGNLGQNSRLTDVRQLHEPRRQGSPGYCSPCRSPEGDGRFWMRGDEYPLSRRSASASGYLYDLTPAAYIDMIICEMGCLHTSAIVAALQDREDRDALLISGA